MNTTSKRSCVNMWNSICFLKFMYIDMHVYIGSCACMFVCMMSTLEQSFNFLISTTMMPTWFTY